jgi:hypothetical protein
VHLGIDETLPGVKVSGRANQMSSESTGFENLAIFMETRSMQWHERRHRLAQKFLNRFVRQNKAEHYKIPSVGHIIPVDLSPAARAIYLELEAHLKSLEMKNNNVK